MKITTLLAFVLALFGSLANAQPQWPTKPVRIVVPAPPGTAPDFFARMYADEFQKAFGQPFLADNKPGAAGIIGTTVVAKAPPDGTTILYGYNQLVTMNPHLYPHLAYDADRDLLPVSIVLGGGYVLLANSDAPVSNLPELIAFGKSQPGKLNYGSYGNGTAMHLGMVLLEQETGSSFTHVPYSQSPNNDLMGGRIQLMLEPTGSAVPLIKSGRVKALAFSGTRRLDVLPNVPTFGETVPGYELVGWQGFWMPAGTPEPVIQRLQREIARITRLPAVAGKMRELGLEPVGGTTLEMTTTIKRESHRWGEIIRARSITLK